jgi:hypothetical protein
MKDVLRAGFRRKAMQIEYGNHIAYLDAQTKLVEIAAACHALE